MKGFITIVAASAVLSASLCAGLAATDSGSGHGLRMQTSASPSTSPAAVPALVAPTTWVDPPAKTGTVCREAAWPYRTAQCAQKAGSQAPVRTVRVIPTAAVPAATASR